MTESSKTIIRQQLRQKLASMNEAERLVKSSAACALIAGSPEYAAASVVMMYLPMPHEVDISNLALRCWQDGKTVVVPKVIWDKRHMLPVEIKSLTSGLTTSGQGVREPASGNPFPVEEIHLAIIPGLGFTAVGHRIGRGMGFYDRFLAQPGFLGVSCGIGFDEQIVDELPVLDHDIPLAMLVTDRSIRRFATNCIEQK